MATGGSDFIGHLLPLWQHIQDDHRGTFTRK
jgi:hypothetical protein